MSWRGELNFIVFKGLFSKPFWSERHEQKNKTDFQLKIYIRKLLLVLEYQGCIVKEEQRS